MKPSRALLFVIFGALISGCTQLYNRGDKVVPFLFRDYKIGRVVLAEGMRIDAIGVDFRQLGQTTTTADIDLKAGVLYNFSKRPGSPVSEMYISIPKGTVDAAYVSVAKPSEGRRCPEQWARDSIGKWCEIEVFPDINYP